MNREEFEQFAKLTDSVHYLAIDPGKNNGVCGYGENCELLFMENIHMDDMIQFLDLFKNVKKCIIEDYLLYPDKAKKQTYSDMGTSRVIGRVESWAERAKVILIKQGAAIKATGYLWLGKKPLPKSNPDNHKMDAHVHFMYWAVRNGLISAASLLK